MSTSRFSWGWVLAVWLALAACSGPGPQLIGAYPKETRSTTYAPPPANLPVIYNAYMELEVASPDAAADEATHLVYDLGGYLLSSDSWCSEGRKYTTLTLAVPVAQFDAAHKDLVGLGRLVREDVAGSRANTGTRVDEWSVFSTLTLQLHPATRDFQFSAPSSSWNPIYTVEQAFGVFASIFTVVADVVIWVVVIVGPFVLMAWGAVSLARKIRRH
jgi:hypothetical protein